METKFRKLNNNWNAEPNAPYEEVHSLEDKVILSFDDDNENRVWLLFPQCWRYRLGSTNDEGWYRGQCRFSKIAPRWGEFYELEGDIKNDLITDWKQGPSKNIKESRHFLFYLRDSIFECDASDWQLITFPQSKEVYGKSPEWDKNKTELIKKTGGLSTDVCIWKNCNNFCLKNTKMCAEHYFSEQSGK